METILKFFVLTLFVISFILTLSVFAETETQLPQDWVDEYSQLHPNSETAIRQRFPDLPDNWSTDALIKAVQNGLLNGSGGYIEPNKQLTRAQLAAIMVRAFGASEEADVSEFTDLRESEWYYKDMARAVQMGIFLGDGTGSIRPDSPITRQEVFVVISRAFDISGAETSVLNQYPDGSLVADWAKDATASMISSGYISGSGGHIKPLDLITRAEFAQVMKNLVDAYITESGTYSATDIPEGNIVIRATGVVLDGVTLKGNLYIGEGVGKAMTLSNVSSDHRVVIRGGTSTVLTGSFAKVSVVVGGLTVNASGADIKDSFVMTGSVLLTPGSTQGWGTVGEDNTQNNTVPTHPEDKDGDGWIDSWY